MSVLVAILLVIILLFGFVIFFGAPYLPTMSKQRQDALRLLNLQPGQTLLELGSGDGRMLVSAAKQGIRCVGYELNPLLFLVSKIICYKYRKLIKLYYGNFWHKNWPSADGIYVFLHTRFMKKLDKKITQQQCGKKVKVVSFAFTIPGRTVVKTKDALFLYVYY